MLTLDRTDKLLLIVLLPAFAVVLFLHVQAILTTGIAQPPFFAAPAANADAYPSVGGPRLEHGVDQSGLRIGDLLIRIGDNELRGVGYIGFDALAVEAAGKEAQAPLVFERNGQQLETTLELLPYPSPWMRLPFLLSCVLAGVVVLLRATRFSERRAFFVSALVLPIAELHFFGGSRWQSYASLIAFNFGGSLAMIAAIRWLIAFPSEVPEHRRLPKSLCWFGSLFTLARLNYMIAGPIHSSDVPQLVLLSDGFFLLTVITILTWNTWHSTAVGRRRSKWVLFGAYASMVPMFVALFPGIFELSGLNYHGVLPFAFISAAFLPLSVLVAVFRYDLFDIDRVLTSFGAYTLSVAMLILIAFVAAPIFTTSVAQMTGVGEPLTRLLLALSLFAIVVPLGQAVRPRFEQIFFPARRRRDRGFRQLYADLSVCNGLADIVDLLTHRLTVLLSPEFVEAHTRSGDDFIPHGNHASQRLPLSAGSLFAKGMASNPRPLTDSDGSLAARVSRLPDEERGFIEQLDPSLIIPLRQGKDLAALLFLGRQTSGEGWTSTDLTLLRGAIEKANAELLRMSHSSNLERERDRASELESLRKSADEANQAKSRFFAAASHDLRQPLHALGLFVDRLESEVEGTQASPLVGQIQRSTRSLTDMFTTLLDLSRIEAGTLEPELKNFPIAQLLETLEGEFEAEAANKGLAFKMLCDPVHVRSDPQLLARILRNLLTNAVRYTETGSVRLEAKRSGPQSESIDLRVIDTGPGIPSDQQREVFREFVQLPRKDGDNEGIGLGLSIVERLARALNHPVSLDSSPESGGATFTIRVPAAAASDTLDATSPARKADDTLEGRRVLVIDDNLDVLDGTRRTLQSWSCDVQVATNLADALRSIEQRGLPEFILADYRLEAGATGIEAIERIRAQSTVFIPAAIVSGETSREAIAAIDRAGFSHLPKPVAPFTLRSVLSAMLPVS